MPPPFPLAVFEMTWVSMIASSAGEVPPDCSK